MPNRYRARVSAHRGGTLRDMSYLICKVHQHATSGNDATLLADYKLSLCNLHKPRMR
jgi:hypothetical protein